MKRAKAVFYALSFLIFLVVAQPAFALDPTKAITQYVHDVWQTDQGLPENFVRAITQTRDGYLWLGTQEGLVRFDGVKFTVFDRTSSPVIQSDDITALLKGRQGSLWIGTRGGLICLRAGVFSAYTRKQGLSSDRVVSLAETRDGDVWIGTDEGGLNRLHGGTFTSVTTRDGLINNHVSALRAGADGSLWVGTESGLVHRLANGELVSHVSREAWVDNRVRALVQDRRGDLWIGSQEGGLSRLHDGKLTSYRLPGTASHFPVRAILEDREGNLWIGSYGGGLYRFNDGKFLLYSAFQGLTTDLVLGLAEDHEGSLWIATEGGGLNRLRDAPFTTYTAADGLPSDHVLVTFRDQAQNLWVATDAGLGERPQGNRDGRFVRDSALDREVIVTMAQDPRGDIWVGTLGGGLYRRHEGQWSRLTKREGLRSNRIKAVHADAAGDVWIGTDAGLNRLRDGVLTTYATQNGLGSDVVNSILDDRRRGLWIGTAGGLSLLRDSGIVTYTTIDGLGSDNVSALYLDRQGTLWVGTLGGGLNRLTVGENGAPKISHYTKQDGLPSDQVFQILEDESANLWIRSDKSIFRLAKRDIEQYSQGKLTAIPAVSYGKADGMKSAEYDGVFQPAVARTSDGRLWFPTTKGIAVIDAAHLKINQTPPPVRIEEVIVDSKSIDLQEARSLSPDSRDLEFHYTALSLAVPEKVRFRYQLEGFDRRWVEAGTRRVAFYTNLSPGNYQFRVRACNNDGVWNDAGAGVVFSIAPHFYQTWPFYLGCTGLLALALLGVHQVRVNLLRAKAAVLEERNRIAQEIHDSLAQNITGILMQLQASQSRLLSTPETVGAHLVAASDLARESLQEARRSVVTLRSPLLEKGNLRGALETLGKQFTAGTSTVFEISSEGTEQLLRPELQMGLLRIAQEALSNAVRHAQAQRIRLALRQLPRAIELAIRDDGRGFEVKSAGAGSGSPGFGLTSMRERAEALGGGVTLKAESGGGTEVVATIPLRRPWMRAFRK